MSFKMVKTERTDYQALYVDGYQTNDLYLCYCGIEYCPPDHCYGPTSRAEYLIHFVFDGKGYFRINGVEYELQKNKAFLIPPYVETYYYADPDAPYSYAWVGFSGEKAPAYIAQTGLSLDCPVCNLTSPAASYLDSIRKILDFKELTLANEVKRVGYLYQLLAQLIESKQLVCSGNTLLSYPTETYAEFAAQYIELNYQHISITDLVRHIGIDRSYLYTVFKRRFQMSPQEFLILCRMKAASELLKNTSHPISWVSQEAGYKDSFSFSKAFKKYYGVSPKFYRT